MVMLGAFYVFPPVWGTLGRNLMPQLYASNATDAVVIRLPTLLSSPLWGQVLVGITSAGAFRGVHVDVLRPARQHVRRFGARHLRQDAPAQRLARMRG